MTWNDLNAHAITGDQQETHHEIRTPERDVAYYLFTYLRISIDIHRPELLPVQWIPGSVDSQYTP